MGKISVSKMKTKKFSFNYRLKFEGVAKMEDASQIIITY